MLALWHIAVLVIFRWYIFALPSFHILLKIDSRLHLGMQHIRSWSVHWSRNRVASPASHYQYAIISMVLNDWSMTYTC